MREGSGTSSMVSTNRRETGWLQDEKGDFRVKLSSPIPTQQKSKREKEKGEDHTNCLILGEPRDSWEYIPGKLNKATFTRL